LDEARETAALAYEQFGANHHDQLVELIHETAFGETSPLGASFYNLNLDHLSTDSVLEYRANHFLRNNLVIAGNGISTEALKSLTDKYVNEIAAGASAGSLPSSTYTGGDNKVRVDLGGKTNLAVGFHAPVGSNGKAYEVLRELLSTRLAGKGVCASAFHFEHSKNGLLGVHTTGCPQTATKNLHSAVEELKAIASGSVDATAAKNKVSVANFSKLEGAHATTYLLNAYLAGEDASKLADNRSVTNEQVSQAAAKLLKTNPTYTVLGATAGTPTYSAIQKLFV
jgi:predicted Zn-dependent peptidase